MSEASVWSDILQWIGKSKRILVKKLARNDCSWADDPGKHQSGVYIPHEIRGSGFFPTLKNVNSAKSHIFESPLETLWPASGETRTSNLKHYSNKGPEMHFTRVPKGEFSGLTPASLLIGGELKEQLGGAWYWFMTVDSASEEAELLESMLDLPADFHFGLFDPSDVLHVQKDETEQLIAELEVALKSGTLEGFISSVSKMPDTAALAEAAQSAYLKQMGVASLNPFDLQKPGDAIMRISRDIEYALYKRAERQHRAAEVLRILIARGGANGGSNLVAAIVRGYSELDGTFLSASQHRKSRAGRSFEQHISRTLRDGNIPFEEQAITGTRRPDFVLPSLLVLKSPSRDFEEALILSAKTTLRERWKQVPMEKFNCGLFLATVDDRVSADAIDDMKSNGIYLVVPESLKTAKETCYGDKPNVISFRTFFDEEVSSKRSHYWQS